MKPAQFMAHLQFQQRVTDCRLAQRAASGATRRSGYSLQQRSRLMQRFDDQVDALRAEQLRALQRLGLDTPGVYR